jgi:hypothetical protein
MHITHITQITKIVLYVRRQELSAWQTTWMNGTGRQ